MILEEVTLSEALSHFVSIGWKVIFATVPPANIYGGWPCFIISLTSIGIVVILINDFAMMLGCVLNIPESITGVTLVALGTSLPDTFASMTAARESRSADSAIGNVTGSNSVNVFLGLGLPWCFAATYLQNKFGSDYMYRVPAGELKLPVFTFLVAAVICFIIIILRRVVSAYQFHIVFILYFLFSS